MDAIVWNQAVKELSAKNYEAARRAFEACGDYKEAKLQLAYLYQEGLGGASDEEKAKKIYEQLADASDYEGTYFLAKLYLKKHQLAQAATYFEKSANLSHVSGAYWAATLYYGFEGYPKDDKRYWYFLKQAASLGHVYAKRDWAWHDIRSATNPLERAKARIRYYGAMIKGIGISIKDPHDARIR